MNSTKRRARAREMRAIVAIARRVRKKSEEIWRLDSERERHGFYDEAEHPAVWIDMGGACGDMSAVLKGLVDRLVGRGLLEYVEGEYDHQPHAWLRTRDGVVVDVTATQFGVRRKVHVTRDRDGRYVASRVGDSAVRNARAWHSPSFKRRLTRQVLESMGALSVLRPRRLSRRRR